LLTLDAAESDDFRNGAFDHLMAETPAAH
jgi:hypothetical protein